MSAVPVLRAPIDAVRAGPAKLNLKADAAPVHPVQLIQLTVRHGTAAAAALAEAHARRGLALLQAEPKQVETRKMLLGKVYGAHMPMRLTMEEARPSQ